MQTRAHPPTFGDYTKTAPLAFDDFLSLIVTVPDKRALPPWRYWLRQKVLPLVRWETPYLAYFQNAIRIPALDSYFAISANLGTHTFYMIFLPILFWCGFGSYGKG